MSATAFPRRPVPLVCALIFAAFHVLTVVTTLVVSRGHGEGPALFVALVDFPLVMLLDAVPHGSYILYKSRVAYLCFFSIAGTLMYAAIGYSFGVLLGALITRLRRAGRRAVAFWFAAIALLAVVLIAPLAYMAFWRESAEDAVMDLAGRVADGRAPASCASLMADLAGGFALRGSEAISFGRRDHEVLIETASGKVISLDAYWRNGEWEITCP
jgi:hypothetical protein